MPSAKSNISGNALREARLNYGASIRAVARAAGVAPSTVIRWENTDLLPKAPTQALRCIAHVLRVRLMERKRPVSKGPHARFFQFVEADTVSAPCMARTRHGGQCKNAPVVGKKRCRLHGGASTGPKTMTGRLICSQAARNMWAKRRAEDWA